MPDCRQLRRALTGTAVAVALMLAVGPGQAKAAQMSSNEAATPGSAEAAPGPGLVASAAPAARQRMSDAPPPSVLDPDEALRASQAAIGRTLSDYAFLDRSGRQVRLASYRGKPLLVNLVYTGCLSACPATTRVVADVIGAAQRTLGPGQFNVVTIGINPPADSPESMRDFARRFGLEAPNWEFLTPYEQQVPQLADELGFRYVPTSWGFDHVAQVTVVDAAGRIHRQVYGEDFEPRRLIEPLKELIAGTPVPIDTFDALAERVRILCTVYDPVSGGYKVNYAIVAEIIGLTLAALTLLFYIVYEFRVRLRARRAAE